MTPARDTVTAAPVRVRDRASGRVEDERVWNESTLRFLYQHPVGSLLERAFLSRRWFSRLYGVSKRRARGGAEIAAFAAALGVDERDLSQPLSAYRSLDELFCRRMKPEVRPIDRAPDHLVSPADCRLLVAPRLDSALPLPVKGHAIPLADLLGDRALAGRYEGGAAFICRLAVADYHRFHFPDGGDAGPARMVGQRLHSVHPIALAAGRPAFANRRAVTLLSSDGFGTMAIVEVGAITVGTIEQTYRPGRVERGAEKGTFHFGGSTIVVCVEPGRLQIDDDLVAGSALGRPGAIETAVKMGTAIGKKVS